jgi:sortase A
MLLRVIFFGVLAGVAFLAYDNARRGSSESTPIPNTPTLAASAASTPTDVPTTPTATLTPSFLLIPSLGVYAPVIEVYLDGQSWDVSNLGMNVGHLQGTAWVDLPGNIVLSAHVEMADGRRGIFAALREMQAGELVILQHGTEERRYSVGEPFTVEPTDLSVLYPTTEEQLTLITCDAYDFLQDTYEQRVVVVAERIN